MTATWGIIREVPAQTIPPCSARVSPYTPLYEDVMLRLGRTDRSCALSITFAAMPVAQRARASLLEHARNRGRTGWLRCRVKRTNEGAVVFVWRGPKWGKTA